MKCEQFRKKLLEDPGNDDPDFHAHRQLCPLCEREFQKARRFEKHLAGAFSDQVQDNSHEKLKAAVLGKVLQHRKSRRRIFSILISLVLLSMLAAMFFHFYQVRSLHDFVLAHIDHEIEQLNNTAIVSPSRLGQFTSQFDVPDLSVLPAITYVEKCWMRTGFGLHLILAGQKGPVTLLFMPDEDIEEGQIIQSRHFNGKLYSYGQGSFALVGVPGEPLEMLAEKLRMVSANAANPVL